MKQYVHPINKNMIVEVQGLNQDEYRIYPKENDDNGMVVSLDILKGFGFIEKEEEPDTDTKWIDDAIEEVYRTPGVPQNIKDAFEHYYLSNIKKAILSHLPIRT